MTAIHDIDAGGGTVVSEIVVRLYRNGAMSVSGNINDEAYALHLIETAKDTLKAHHAKLRTGQRGGLIVPAYDTSLVGTMEERMLLKARDELAEAADMVKS